MPDLAVHDVRSLDPASYIRVIGLRPEDSYGFLPLDLHDVTPCLFLYRDRPEYGQARSKLPAAEEVRRFGPVEVMPTQEVEIQAEDGGEIDMGELLSQAVQTAEQQTAEASGPGSAPIPAVEAPDDAPPIVVHRVYPRLHMRASTRQLDHFMPRYREALSLCSEDVYGIYPRGTRTSVTGSSSSTEWDDFWIVYRDRPEYAAGRDAWAEEMGKGEKWPAPVLVDGVAAESGVVFDGTKVKVEKDRWPRKRVVMRKKGAELAQSLKEKIAKWGYMPEDSLGFCPDFGNGRIYFAWRNG